MLNKYLIFLPEVQGSIEEEWRQCLKQLSDVKESGLRLVKLNIFTDLPDYKSYIDAAHEIGKSVISTFADSFPVFTVTAHPPEKPWKIAVEAGYMNTDYSEIISKIRHSIPYVVSLSGSGKEIWAGGMGTGSYQADTRRAAETAFDQMRDILHSEDMSLNNLVRQWNYIGNILEIKNESQNYQVFNEVRSKNYHKYRHIPFYPAATGIGMRHGGVILDCCAVKAESSTKILPVNNPDQVNPYIYGQQVLKGIPSGRKKNNQPPQFERALLFSYRKNTTLFISGTAAIIGQDTVGIDDVERQTVVTIENIARLTDVSRLRHLMGNPELDKGKMILLRIYVRSQDDFARVKSVCEKLHPGVPAIFIQSDICRDNLLVEIEAELSITN